MKFKNKLMTITAFFSLYSIGTTACPKSDYTFTGQTVAQVSAGQNGAGQQIGYFRVSGEGGECDYVFLVNDLGKIYYSTLLTALSSGMKIDFWSAGDPASAYIPGNGGTATGHWAGTIKIQSN